MALKHAHVIMIWCGITIGRCKSTRNIKSTLTVCQIYSECAFFVFQNGVCNSKWIQNPLTKNIIQLFGIFFIFSPKMGKIWWISENIIAWNISYLSVYPS